MRKGGFGPSSEINVVVRYGRTVCISVHCLLKSQWFGRDSRFMLNKVFGALAANLGSGSTDGGLSSIAVCFLHGCHGNNIHTVVYLVGSFICGLFCGAGLVLCFLGLPDGGRSPATAETVSVCVGHGQNGSGGVRRRNRALSSPTDSEDGFDCRHAQHHRKDVRFSERPLLDSRSDGDVYPELLRVPPATGVIWLNERKRHYPDDAGRHLEQVYEFGAHRRVFLYPEVIVRAVLGAQETEDTCRECESPFPAEAVPPPAIADTAPDRKVDEGDSLDPGDTVADPLLEARVLSVQRNSAGDRHREFHNAVSELVQSPWSGWCAIRCPVLVQSFHAKDSWTNKHRWLG